MTGLPANGGRISGPDGAFIERDAEPARLAAALEPSAPRRRLTASNIGARSHSYRWQVGRPCRPPAWGVNLDYGLKTRRYDEVEPARAT
jgi:hypothetical protein